MSLKVTLVPLPTHVRIEYATKNVTVVAVSLFRPETSEEDVRELASVCLKGQPGLIKGICRAYMIKMKSEKFSENSMVFVTLFIFSPTCKAIS